MHNFNVIPVTNNEGYFAVASAYTGGTTIIDFTTPSAPREISFYEPSGVDGRGRTDVWSSYWYNDYIWGNDINRGFDVFKVLGENGRLLTRSGTTVNPTDPNAQQFRARKFHHMNPQTQETFQTTPAYRSDSP